MKFRDLGALHRFTIEMRPTKMFSETKLKCVKLPSDVYSTFGASDMRAPWNAVCRGVEDEPLYGPWTAVSLGDGNLLAITPDTEVEELP